MRAAAMLVIASPPPCGRRPGVDKCQRRALAHAHSLTAKAVEAAGGDSAIGHRLSGADHLVAHHLAGNRAITNGDQELFAGDTWVAEHAGDGIGKA